MNMKRAIVAIAAVLGVVCVCHGRTVTVDDDGLAEFASIQAAIDDANDGDTVLVADGTYRGDGNRDIDFRGKAITVISENGPETCIIDCNGTEADRHRGFYFYSGEGRLSAVMGFTITNGYAPGVCLLPRPPFNCDYLGGGICCKESSPAISHCKITGNWAEKGGGIYFEGRAPEVSQCTIVGNRAVDWGGGIAFNSSNPEIRNCIIRSNSAPSYPQIYDSGSGSVAAAYSDVQGGWAGTGNIDADPCFVDPGYWDPNGTPEDTNDDFWVDGDYHLKSQGGRWDANGGGWTMDEVTGVCIDAGDPTSPIGLEPFPNGGRINMGAYGGTSEASKSYLGPGPCETIVAGDVNGDCRVDLADFAILAVHWLECATPQPESYADYFPLSVGNSWTYADCNDGSIKTFTIIGTEEINGHIYYKFDDYWGELREGEEYLFRYESHRVLMWDSWWYARHGEEVVRYDFTASSWDDALLGACRLKQDGVSCSVPAGDFSYCIYFQFLGTYCGPDAYYYGEYLAPNVGNIKYVVPGGEFPGLGSEGDILTFELQSCTIISD